MGHTRKIIILCVVVLTFVSCKKENIELPETNDPVFRIDGTFDGQNLTMIAGDDGFYMYTMTQEENGVKVFSGELMNENISVEIGIYDGKLDRSGNDLLADISSSSIWAKNYGQPLVILQKDAFPNADFIESIKWIVNGQMFDNIVEIDAPGLYHVCAIVTYQDMDTDELCEDMIIGYERGANCRINHYLNQEGKMSAWLGNIDGSIEQTKWYFGDSDTLAGEGNEFSTPLDSGRYQLKAVVDFAGGIQRTKTILVDGALENKYIDDFSVFEKEAYPINNQDFNVRVIIRDDGVEYSSMNCDNMNSTLDITDIDYYELNSSGNKAYKVTANVTCNVATLGGVSKPFSGQIQFGIEIEN